jgi:hypothetical protein
MSDANTHLKLYEEYNKSLRTWLLSFGIGALALLLSNKELADKFSDASTKSLIVYLFLFGCSTQIAIAFINKICSWCMYTGESNKAFANTRRYACARAVDGWFWLDVLLDIAAIGSFGTSVVMMAKTLL